ncbi:hypothetical protein Lser_V15G01988 [Lactuca serriola]
MKINKPLEGAANSGYQNQMDFVSVLGLRVTFTDVSLTAIPLQLKRYRTLSTDYLLYLPYRVYLNYPSPQIKTWKLLMPSAPSIFYGEALRISDRLNTSMAVANGVIGSISNNERLLPPSSFHTRPNQLPVHNCYVPPIFTTQTHLHIFSTSERRLYPYRCEVFLLLLETFTWVKVKNDYFHNIHTYQLWFIFLDCFNGTHPLASVWIWYTSFIYRKVEHAAEVMDAL